jgi:glycosyltransferase involved in cell wall biosynthesis
VDTPPAKTVLFVGHDAYRAGAQIAMLHLLSWLRSHLAARIAVLLKEGGDLLSDYRAVAPTYVLNVDSPGKRLVSRAMHRLRGLGGQRSNSTVPRRLSSLDVDLIYVNSAASLDVLPALLALWSCPVICHVHELEVGLRRDPGTDMFRAQQQRVDGFIAVSDAVRENLLRNHEVAAARIHRIYEGIAPPESSTVADARGRADVRRALSLPTDAFVVGGCGTMDWRKAPDVFIQVARHLASMRPDLPAHFLWVGGQSSGADIEALQYVVDRLGLRSRLHFVGPKRDPLPYFALFDVFLLTSREDPFPLVVLEAAALGLPTVCFQGAGGMPEFVGADAGFVVKYLDIPAAASAIAQLADSPELRLHLGRQAAEKVQRGHTIDVIGSQVLRLVETYLETPRASSPYPAPTSHGL